MALDKTNIKVALDKCSQCLACQLICSFQYTSLFNPLKARISITRGYHKDGLWKPNQISFTDECLPHCQLCAHHCAYGALEPVKERD